MSKVNETPFMRRRQRVIEALQDYFDYHPDATFEELINQARSNAGNIVQHRILTYWQQPCECYPEHHCYPGVKGLSCFDDGKGDGD